MSRTAAEFVFPAAVALLVCTLVVLFLTAAGLDESALSAARAQSAAGNQSPCAGPQGPQESDAPPQALLSAAEAEAVAAGDALFKNNCAQCHAVNDVVVGPALAGLTRRRPLPWIVKWVQNSSRVVASGDEYAVKVFNQYQKQQMPSFALSAAEIQSIITYIDSQEGRTHAVPTMEIVAAL